MSSSEGGWSEDSLFGPIVARPDEKPVGNEPVRHRLLITVKAAPNPSEHYGETVCVAGIRIDDLGQRTWARLYPINFRELGANARFHKYDIVSVECRPAAQDPRIESWKPDMTTLRVEKSLAGWPKRQPWVTPLIEYDMCSIRIRAQADVRSQSLALVRPSRIRDFVVTTHPGWTREEQNKIDRYVSQLDLLDTRERTPLEAPRFRGAYHWQCHAVGCPGHKQGIIDWEVVALQRRLAHLSDDALKSAMREKFLDTLCAPARSPSFFVGNQAKRAHVFSILGVYWPRVGD